MEKFYDRLNLRVVAELGRKLEYPLKPLVLALLQHTAPRSIKADGHYSPFVIPNRSIARALGANFFVGAVFISRTSFAAWVHHPRAAKKKIIIDQRVGVVKASANGFTSIAAVELRRRVES